MKPFFILFICCVGWNVSFGQTAAAADGPEYIRNPEIPAFTIYTAPDSTLFQKENLHKNESTLFMVFSPECGHCQLETEVLLKNIAHFPKTQIVMVTWLPYQEMMSFYKTYHIADYPQITMGWDRKDFFLPYYHVQSYPSLIAYNKDGKLVKSFNGDIKMEEVWTSLGNK